MSEAVQITYDKQSFDAETLQKAAYRNLNDITLEYVVDGNTFRCTLKANNGISDEKFHQAVEEFRKDVIDYQLRSKIKNETEPVRNLILGLVFSQTGLQGNE